MSSTKREKAGNILEVPHEGLKNYVEFASDVSLLLYYIVLVANCLRVSSRQPPHHLACPVSLSSSKETPFLDVVT